MSRNPATDKPPPGSLWARHCPDAYPAEWFETLGLAALPVGFARFATDDEAVLIAGRIDEAEFLRRTRRGSWVPPSPPPSAEGTARPRSGDRFRVLNGFTDFDLRDLTRGEVAVWLVLFRDTRGGVAVTGQADIATRAGLSVRGVQKALSGLAARGLVEVVRRGGPRAGVSSYRVRWSGG